MKKDLGQLRKVYKKGSLEIGSVGKDPLLFFEKWFDIYFPIICLIDNFSELTSEISTWYSPNK